MDEHIMTRVQRVNWHLMLIMHTKPREHLVPSLEPRGNELSRPPISTTRPTPASNQRSLTKAPVDVSSPKGGNCNQAIAHACCRCSHLNHVTPNAAKSCAILTVALWEREGRPSDDSCTVGAHNFRLCKGCYRGNRGSRTKW